MKNAIADRIRMLRLAKNFSQQNMADELNITVGAYSNMERGKSNITVTRLFEIAEVLEVDITELLVGSDTVMEKSDPDYGFASKSDIESLRLLIAKLNNELGKLKNEISDIKKPTKISRKKK